MMIGLHPNFRFFCDVLRQLFPLSDIREPKITRTCVSMKTWHTQISSTGCSLAGLSFHTHTGWEEGVAVEKHKLTT